MLVPSMKGGMTFGISCTAAQAVKGQKNKGIRIMGKYSTMMYIKN